MKTVKKSLKINSNGELVEFNERLRRWELVSRSWNWDDIDPNYLAESKENWGRNQFTGD